MLNEACSKWQIARKFNRIAASVGITLITVIATSTFNVFASSPLGLAWDANGDSATAGYFLHSTDIAGNPISKTDVGSQTTATVSGLIDGTTYVFYVTAYTSTGIESDPSNKIPYQSVPPNTPPTADNKSVQMLQDQNSPVVLSGSDANGDALTFSVVTLPTKGTLSGAPPNLTYSPISAFYGTDSFTYAANDGKVSSAPATVSITVYHVNHAPVADAKNIQTPQDQSVAVTLSGSDPDGDSLVFSLISVPSHGTLTGIPPNLNYTPAAGFYGSDSFNYSVKDATLSSTPATVSITVYHVNHAPVADAKNIQTLQDQSVAVTLSGSDPDGDSLLFSVISAPSHGTLSGTPPSLSYTPAAGFYGTDSFTYVVKDAALSSTPATVSITVQHVNHAPVADAKNIQTPQDQSVALTLSGSDPDGDSLVFSMTSAPSQGTLTGTPPNLTYSPTPGFYGTDFFAYAAKDATLSSAPATVSITVYHVNHAPVADAKNIQTPQDQSVALMLSGSDSDGDSLVFSVTSVPTHGTLSGTPPNLTYLPALGFYGTDSFNYSVKDAILSSAPATVSITVQHVNHAPVADAKSIQTLESQKVAVTLSGSDPDGDSISFSVVGTPSHGTLTGTPPNMNYTPVAGFYGMDSFTYSVKDATLSSAPATVSITVQHVNHAPVADAKSIQMLESQNVAVTLSGSDPDGDSLLFSVVSAPSHGTLTGTLPQLIYTPAAGYYGTDTFSYTASDAALTSMPAVVSITVQHVNHTPVADVQSIETPENQAVAVPLSGSDADGDSLVFNVVSGPSHGTLSGTLLNLSYTPAAGYYGSDSISYTANDGSLTSSPALIAIIVTHVNSAPVADSKNIQTVANQAVSVILSGSDSDEDALTYSILSAPAHGSLSGTAPNLVYTPASGFTGTDGFTYQVNDGMATSAAATVTVTVNALNSPPVANSRVLIISRNTASSIVLSGQDPEGDPLSFSIITGPSHGTLTGTAPNVIYTPARNYIGYDSFTFVVSDGQLTSAPATVNLSVMSASGSGLVRRR